MFKVLAIIGALLAVLEAVKENNKKKSKLF
jgi:hypothetical protein